MGLAQETDGFSAYRAAPTFQTARDRHNAIQSFPGYRRVAKTALLQATVVSSARFMNDLVHFTDKELIGRMLLSVLLGGIIGVEREMRDKPAGFRTILLICFGSCLFTVLSEIVGERDGERTRIAAQIVAGIGFLGAGAILRAPQGIFGLTTAATIYAVSAIGMSAGFGYYKLSIVGTAIILFALFLLNRIEETIGNYRVIQHYHVSTEISADALDRVLAQFAIMHVTPMDRTIFESAGRMVVELRAMGSKKNHESLRIDLIRSPEFQLGKNTP